MQSVVDELFALQDPAYREFQAGLVPTVDPARIIGVRTPALRAFAKRFAREGRAAEFMAELPHRYYEENNLHGELVNLVPACGDVRETFAALDVFLPYVDNWATCDLLSPKVLDRHPVETFAQVRDVWLPSGRTYTVRFGVSVLMSRYLSDGRFDPGHLALVADLPPGDYYIDMARAWYFSMALVKQYEATVPLFTTQTLDPWTHNKALQKARESRRIDAETKAFLQGLKVPLTKGDAPAVR